MKFGSLFSGIGGFDLGFEQAGLSCEWQVEIDNDCQKVLAKRFPDVSRYTDVKDVGKLPTVDVICGGFPCQDLSVAGKRSGLAGERSGLWFEFLRIIECNRPRWVVIENVPGLLSSWSPLEPPPDAVEGREWDVEENSDFEIILTGLSELGYCLASRVLDAQYDGVAQRRERVFIVGSLGDGSSAEILFESKSVSWNPPTRREAGPGVANTISGGAHPGGHNGQDDMSVIPIYHENIDGKIYESSECPALRNSHMNGGGQVAIAFDTTQITSRENRNNPQDGDPCHPLASAAHAPALAGQFGVRRLTPRECERLQGFPDDWTLYDATGKEISDSARYRMLGNAVAVPVAEWIGQRLRGVTIGRQLS
jgi:DNA (cytosine-5)-methyltransferase 1